MPDELSLTDLNNKLKNAIDIIDMQRHQIEAYVASLSVIGDQLVSLHADTNITKVAVSVLLAEAAGRDRKKLDRLLALSVARTEASVDQLGEPAKSAVLTSIDELIGLTETMMNSGMRKT